MTRPQQLSEDAAQFVRELKAADIRRPAIVRETKKRFPNECVSRWTIDLVLYPKIAERTERDRKKRAAERQSVIKPQAPQEVVAKRQRPPRVMVAEMLEGVPDMNRLIAWVERAKRLMPADPEPAFDITHALRRLDLIERTHAYRIRSTTQAEQSASIQ